LLVCAGGLGTGGTTMALLGAGTPADGLGWGCGWVGVGTSEVAGGDTMTGGGAIRMRERRAEGGALLVEDGSEVVGAGSAGCDGCAMRGVGSA